MDQDILRKTIQEATKAAYAMQETRIKKSNDICSRFRKSCGLPKADRKEPAFGAEEDPKTMGTLIQSHNSTIIDGKLPSEKEFQKRELLENYETLLKVQQYLKTRKLEEEAFEAIRPHLEKMEIYNTFLKSQNFISLGIHGILLGWFNIHFAKFPSSFWSFAGLNPKKEKKVEIGTQQAFIKAKLVSDLGAKIIRSNSPWFPIVQDYKKRIEADPAKSIRSNGHLHNMTVRYTIKEFLKELHLTWKSIEGYPPTPIYNNQDQTK